MAKKQVIKSITDGVITPNTVTFKSDREPQIDTSIVSISTSDSLLNIYNNSLSNIPQALSGLSILDNNTNKLRHLLIGHYLTNATKAQQAKLCKDFAIDKNVKSRAKKFYELFKTDPKVLSATTPLNLLIGNVSRKTTDAGNGKIDTLAVTKTATTFVAFNGILVDSDGFVYSVHKEAKVKSINNGVATVVVAGVQSLVKAKNKLSKGLLGVEISTL